MRCCSTLREEVGHLPCNPATTPDVDEVRECPWAWRSKVKVENGSRAAIYDVSQYPSDNCTLVAENEVVELIAATPEGDELLQAEIAQDES